MAMPVGAAADDDLEQQPDGDLRDAGVGAFAGAAESAGGRAGLFPGGGG